MNFLVFGAGAVGGYLGGRLAAAGHRVVFLGRPSAVEALRSQGLRVDDPAGGLHIAEPQARTALQEAHQLARPEVILLTVKAYDCREAAEQLAAIGTDSPIVSFLNGVGNEDLLVRLLGEGRVVAASLTSAVQVESPFRIIVERSRGVGIANDHPAAKPLAEALVEASVETRLYGSRSGLKWSKLLTNLLGNATTAVTGLSPGEIYSRPGLYRLEMECLREATRVMGVMGVPTYNLPGAPSAWLARLIELPSWLTRPLLRWQVGRARGDKMPSLFYDVEQGRTEVAWLNGAVVGACDEAGLPAPANRLLTQAVHNLSKEPEAVAQQRLTADELLANAARIGVPGLREYNRPGR